ncbi:ABC transporter ATP-binding protein [Granulosicoccus sp.]|nr:ABC transporter ATP-binding protein [Granulosicoccus sp.]
MNNTRMENTPINAVSITTPAIELRGIRKTFVLSDDKNAQKVLALDGIDLTINLGEFLTIIGPSGCGKTTLLRIMASLAAPDEGEVIVAGEAVTEPGIERAMVFQTFGLFPWKTVIDNVMFPLTVRKLPVAQAREIAMAQIEQVGLEKFTNAFPHQLSGGMQQRVGLARALSTGADILLMDEPFGAIDAQTRELMQEELMRIWQDEQKTVVFITHDLDEAVLLADRVLLMSRGPGRVRELIPVELPRPRTDYDVRAHEEFIRVRAHLWHELRNDLIEQREQELS